MCAGNSSFGPVVATLQLSPPGDAFDDALETAGSWVKRTGSLANCSWETSGPFHAGTAPKSTLWFRWTAPSSGNFRVLAKSGTTNFRTAAYSGVSVSSLNERGSGLGEFTFTAVAGQEYRIVVNGSNTNGNFDLVIAKEIPAYSTWRDAYFDSMVMAVKPFMCFFSTISSRNRPRCSSE